MKRHIRSYFTSHSHKAQFMRFATVGMKVSLIDAGGVYLLPWLFGMNLYVARIISLSVAIVVGYLLNRYFTFGKIHRGHFFRQFIGHFSVFLLGGLINYGVFSAIITVGHRNLTTQIALNLLPLFALWMGGIAGLIFNFVFCKTFVFRSNGEPMEAASSS
jgi:putative flippase GtrA